MSCWNALSLSLTSGRRATLRMGPSPVIAAPGRLCLRGGKMADDSDRANDLAERERAEAIRAITTRPALAYCGRCRNCDEPLEQGAFCDASCAEGYRKREAFRR